MEIREFEGLKITTCREAQDTIHKLLLELDELMEDLKVLDIPNSEYRTRTRHFREVMGMIFKLNGLDYEIFRGMDRKVGFHNSMSLVITDDVKKTLKECIKVMDEADDFLDEYRG